MERKNEYSRIAFAVWGDIKESHVLSEVDEEVRKNARLEILDLPYTMHQEVFMVVRSFLLRTMPTQEEKELINILSKEIDKEILDVLSRKKISMERKNERGIFNDAVVDFRNDINRITDEGIPYNLKLRSMMIMDNPYRNVHGTVLREFLPEPPDGLSLRDEE